MDKKITGKKVTENLYLCTDGKYRWSYEFAMMKNPTLLFSIWKVMGMAFGIVFVIELLIQLAGGGFRSGQEFWEMVRGFLLLYLVVGIGIGGISYIILAGKYGWKYIVLFTMDENGVEHRQMKKQFDKAKALGWLTAAAGLSAGNLTSAGTGILAATKESSTSDFRNVRKVKAVRRRNVIYVNQKLEHNQVYAAEADFDFVRNYIVGHCPNAKVSG